MEVLDFEGLTYYDSKVKEEMDDRYGRTINALSNDDIQAVIDGKIETNE